MEISVYRTFSQINEIFMLIVTLIKLNNADF